MVEYIPLMASFLTLIGVLYQGRKIFKSAQAQLARDAAAQANNNDNSRYDQIQEDLKNNREELKKEQERNETLLNRFNVLTKQVDDAREASEKVRDTLGTVVEDNKKLRYTLQLSVSFIKQQQEHARNHNITPLELPELLRSI